MNSRMRLSDGTNRNGTASELILDEFGKYYHPKFFRHAEFPKDIESIVNASAAPISEQLGRLKAGQVVSLLREKANDPDHILVDSIKNVSGLGWKKTAEGPLKFELTSAYGGTAKDFPDGPVPFAQTRRQSNFLFLSTSNAFLSGKRQPVKPATAASQQATHGIPTLPTGHAGQSAHRRRQNQSQSASTAPAMPRPTPRPPGRDAA